jgi:hypothetical protein
MKLKEMVRFKMEGNVIWQVLVFTGFTNFSTVQRPRPSIHLSMSIKAAARLFCIRVMVGASLVLKTQFLFRIKKMRASS